MMAHLNAGTSRDEDLREEDAYDTARQDSIVEVYQRVFNDRRKRDVSRVKASRAAISKRRLHGAQGNEVDWEDKQLPISSGQHCSDSYSNNYAQVKKPLTELIENPTGCRKLGHSLGGGCEKYACLQNGKHRNVYELALFEDVVPYTRQDIDSIQMNHSISPKAAMKRVNSDDALNEFLGRSVNKHIFNVNKNYHKGIKFRKSRENLEIRRRHSSVGGSLSIDEFNYYSRRTLWRKFSHCHLGLNNVNGEAVHNVDLLNDLVNYDDDKDLIQEKRVCRSGIGDVSFTKEELQCDESKNFNDHPMPSKYLLVNDSKLFMRGDFATHLSVGEYSYFSKANNFGEDLWGPGTRNLDLCRPRCSVNEIGNQSSLENWSDFSEISSCFSMIGPRMRCEVPLSIMANICSPSWAEGDFLRTVNITKSIGELKMSPIYQSQSGAIMARKSCSDWPVRDWTHRRCLPKIPQLWKEGRSISLLAETTKETEEEHISTSSEAAVSGSEDTSAINVEENEPRVSCDQLQGSNLTTSSEPQEKTVEVAEKSASSQEPRASYLPLRASLFPYVPPFIQFAKHDERGPPIHGDIKSIAKWKLGKFTPSIVQLIIKNTGLDLLRHCDEYVGTWAKNLSPSGFSHIKESQKINHIPGGFYIGRKDSLSNNLKKMKNVFGAAEYYFVPETYVLPAEIYFLKQEWNEAEEKKEATKWIVKPPAGARGSGVSVIHSWGQIPHSKPVVVQKYIANPYLIDSTKFDLRVYVLITSVHPLRMYVYDEGLVRFASDVYSPDTSTLSDKYVHLTNYSVNKKSSRYMVNQDPSACQGHKWTLSSLWSFLRARHVNIDGLWEKIVDIAIKTFLSGESAISRCSNTCLNTNYPAYELFGLDIILDSELRPWLLEVNISPSLNTSSKLDMSVKGPMMSELLNLVGYHLPPSQRVSVSSKRTLIRQLMGTQSSDEGEASRNQTYPGLLFDKRIYTKALSSEEKRKHLTYTDMYSSRMKYCDSILRILMPDDVRHLLISEDELSQAERFQRVYPSVGMSKYYKFFNGPRYYNMLHEAWEKRYSDDREAGIELLQELCRNRLHLRTPLSMSSLKYGAKLIKSRESLSQKSAAGLAQRKTKEDISKKKLSESVTKKNVKERVTVKTRKHLDLMPTSFSGSTNGRPRVKFPTSHTLSVQAVRKPSNPKLNVSHKRNPVRPLNTHRSLTQPASRFVSVILPGSRAKVVDSSQQL